MTMITLTTYQILEIVFGLFIIWVSFYLISRNPNSTMSWVVFVYLYGFGFTTFLDTLLTSSRNLQEYIVWQKITDWSLFLTPVFYYHASLLVVNKNNSKNKYILIIGYILGVLLYITDIHGGIILREDVVRLTDFRRFDGFAPGILLVPATFFMCLYYFWGANNFFFRANTDLKKFKLPALGGMLYVMIGIISTASYYLVIPYANFIFMGGFILATLFFIFPMIKYHLFSPAEKNIFDQTFYYKTAIIFFIILSYLLVVYLSGIELGFNALVLAELLTILVLFSHSFYDWLSTFVNDLIYNPSRGFSIVNDEEVNNVMKHYNEHERLESSPLMRLNIVNNQIAKNKELTPVDALRSLVKESVEYFKPETEPTRRIKKNLKYQLLKMFVFDDAEEGQILWELGFEYYPVKIMSQERKYRSPLFEVLSPSDYVFTSRNAYLALKKEAIHDITWRISYLEKQSKKRAY